MRIATPTLISAAMTAVAIVVAPAAHAGPTVAQQCDAQTWPRPVPDVVGMMFELVMKQIPAGTSGAALASWDNIRGVTQDGQDAAEEMGGWDRITAISPAPGTPVARDQLITVALAPMDYSAPTDFRPCDWVTTGEVAAHCLTNLHGTQGRPYNEIVILLDDNRLFEVEGLGAEPCEQLKQLATTAIDRL
jgi:hypothetical protein